MMVKEDQEQLGQETASGLGWTTIANLIRIVASFGIGVLLARLLSPSDFGIIGIAYIVIGFAYVLRDVGLGAAIIQRKDVTERHVRVCQTISTAVAVFTTVVLFGAAGTVASFFDEPRVAPVIQVLALGSLFTGFSVASRALLVRQLAFKTTVRIELLASILGYGGVAVAMAVAGYGYWSLVYGTLAQTVLSSLLAYMAVRHTLWPLAARSEVRELFGFSSGITLNSIANFFAVKGDSMVIGRLMDAASLGFYSRAYALMELPVVAFGDALNRVLFPAASKVQDDSERFRRSYLMAFSMSVALSLPLSLTLVILAPELILTLYGHVWAPAIPILQVLCVFGMFRMTYNTASAFIKAAGQSYRLFTCTIVFLVLIIGGSWWAAGVAGLAGVAWAVGGAITAMWLLVVNYANRAAGVSIGQLARVLWFAVVPGLAVTAGLLVLATVLRVANLPSPLVLMLAGTAAGAGTMACGLYQVRRFNHPGINAVLQNSVRRMPYLSRHIDFVSSTAAPR